VNKVENSKIVNGHHLLLPKSGPGLIQCLVETAPISDRDSPIPIHFLYIYKSILLPNDAGRLC